MDWNWLRKKEKVVPVQPFPIEEIKAQLLALPKDPNAVYVMWWEQALNPAHLEFLRRRFASTGLAVVVIAGLRMPEIYKLRKSWAYPQDGQAIGSYGEANEMPLQRWEENKAKGGE